jgi:hypothetical protein
MKTAADSPRFFAWAAPIANLFLAKHYRYVMIANAAADYRSFIKVDEVDGRSPVERAAAAFVPQPASRTARADATAARVLQQQIVPRTISGDSRCVPVR